MFPSLTPFRDDLPIPPVVRPHRGPRGPHLTITAKVALLRLHADLPAARLWSYRLTHGEVVSEGAGHTYLGPTVEVERGEQVAAAWENGVLPAADDPGTLPYEVVKIDSADPAAGTVPQNLPGAAGALDDAQDPARGRLRNLRAALVTHLHGGRTQADSDGWPDNTAAPGQAAHYTYHNDQPATMLWYHDHAMHVTRLNVFAGLAGAWIIRDAEEAALNLPSGRHELPLVIQDRNLALDNGGDFTGPPLHKTEVNGGPGEFFGPYTLVNGRIWPRAAVEPALYRLRLLNGSNARTYRLVLLDGTGTPRHDKAWLIGNDQGLRRDMLPLPADGLLLAPAERADLLVDFSGFGGGSLYLWNTAEAPFGADPGYRPDAKAELQALLADPLAGRPEEAGRRPFPQVMRFDVGTAAHGRQGCLPGGPLRATPPSSAELTEASTIRLTALVERPAPGPAESSMLVFWEYQEITEKEPAPEGAPEVSFTFTHPVTGAPATRRFWKAAEEFYDRINWKVHLGSTEQWYVVNLSPDTHPIHVHLVDMQVTQRSAYDVFVTTKDNPTPVLLTPGDGERTPVVDGTPVTGQEVTRIDATTPLDPEPDQAGAKDTVRVNPGEMLGFAMKFAPFCGRYMLHCHILEHEDHDMMRPYVVVDPSVPHHEA